MRERCVNIDWLEVYVLESPRRFPCNADYFRLQGYWVKEREYGTRQYNEMFTIFDEHGEPIIEVRRNPASGESSFSGLVPESSHIRLTNRACYLDNAVEVLRDFLIRHDYIFKRIFRIDICYDFEYFDSGDDPAKFAQRYLAKKYSKINQCRLSTHGEDNWSDFEWETLSWGSQKSMVSTKLYNKSKELATVSKEKTYIPHCWLFSGLIDNPLDMTKVSKKKGRYKPKIWRLEFSLKSSANNWLVIEDQGGKRMKKKAVPHTLALFDSKDKIWARIEDMVYHYFRFKYREEGQRKDRCRDKVLFRFNEAKQFSQVHSLPPAAKPDNNAEILRRRLALYKVSHTNADVRRACEVLLKYIEDTDLRRFASSNSYVELEALRRTIAYRMEVGEKTATEYMSYIKDLLTNKEIF